MGGWDEGRERERESERKKYVRPPATKSQSDTRMYVRLLMIYPSGEYDSPIRERIREFVIFFLSICRVHASLVANRIEFPAASWEWCRKERLIRRT